MKDNTVERTGGRSTVSGIDLISPQHPAFRDAGIWSDRIIRMLEAAGIEGQDMIDAVAAVHGLGHAHQQLGYAAALKEGGIPTHGAVITTGSDARSLAGELQNCAAYVCNLARGLDRHFGATAFLSIANSLYGAACKASDEFDGVGVTV